MDEEIRALAERVSRRLVEQGAKATLLTGHHARGNARPDSDVDVFSVGEGPSGWMEIADGRLVSVYWWSAEETRRPTTRSGPAPWSAKARTGGAGQQRGRRPRRRPRFSRSRG